MTAHASMAKTKHDAATGHSRGHSVAMHDSYKRQPVPTGAAKPLAPALSEEMGRRFSEDFDSVRLHEGADARAGADALDARAYTFGEHIVLGRAAAPPDTAEGKRTLAHELAHVVQQRRGGPPPALSADAPHEHGAERAAGMFVSGTGAVSVTGATGIGVARDPVDDVKKRKGAAKPKAKSTKLPGVDAKTDAAVEKGIVEEPTAQPPPKAPKTQKVKTTQEAKDARKKFNTKRDKHAQSLSVAKGGQVHHGVELQALKRYPGAFTAEELNAPGNMRGIRPELEGKRQLHNSKVREVWDRHYNNLDAQLKAKGLKKGTPAFRAFARKFLLEARAEMDHLYGQFYSESHAAEAAKSKKQTTKQGATKPKSATKQAPKKASKPGAKQSGQASKASAGKSKPAAKTSSKQKPKAQAKPAATPSSKSLSKAGPTPPKAAAKPASKLPSKAPSQSKPAVKAAQQAAKAQPKSTAIPPPKAKPAAAPKAPVSKAAVKAPPPKAVMSAPVPQALPKSAPKNIPKSSPPAKSG
ncbi:MAG: DUF4157 domain-containing protein, partial [Lysobacter sp.]|nr:DUF4157 domain-containing protein [Lysobacter sp.]